MKDETGKGRPARREVGAERLRSVAAHQFARKRGAGRMRVASCECSVHVAANVVSSFSVSTPSGRITCMCVCACVCACTCVCVRVSSQV